MTKRAPSTNWLLFPLISLVAFLVGAIVTQEGGREALLTVSTISFGLFMFAAIVLRIAGSRRCPACGDARFPRQPTHGIYECDACGAHFRRVRQGATVWLGQVKPPGLPELPFRRARFGSLESIPNPPDDRWSWIEAFLPRMRALRQRLRPLAGKPARILNLIKPARVELDLPASLPAPGTLLDRGAAPAGPLTVRGLVGPACAASVIGTAVLSMVPSLARVRRLDDVYWIIVVIAICVCECMVLAIGQMLRLTRTASLALFAADLTLKALHLAAVGRLPDAYVLGSMAIVFPLTPLLLSPFFRRWRVVDEAAGEFTTGHLLRNKQARAGRTSAGARRAG